MTNSNPKILLDTTKVHRLFNKKFKTIALYLLMGIVGSALLASCKKDDDTIDPNKVKIEQLKEKIAKLKTNKAFLAGLLRGSTLDSAKTVDQNITSYLNSQITLKAIDLSQQGVISINNQNRPQTLADSINVFKYTVEQLRQNISNPLPWNDNTLTNLYNKSVTYISTIKELDALIKELEDLMAQTGLSMNAKQKFPTDALLRKNVTPAFIACKGKRINFGQRAKARKYTFDLGVHLNPNNEYSLYS